MTVETNTYYMKEGDCLPRLEITILDSDGNPLDLDAFSHAYLVVAPCVDGRRIIDMQEMDFVGRVEGAQTGDNVGKVAYDWQTGNTDKSGEYLLEVILDTETEQGDAGERTSPSLNYHKLIITPRL